MAKYLNLKISTKDGNDDFPSSSMISVKLAETNYNNFPSINTDGFGSHTGATNYMGNNGALGFPITSISTADNARIYTKIEYYYTDGTLAFQEIIETFAVHDPVSASNNQYSIKRDVFSPNVPINNFADYQFALNNTNFRLLTVSFGASYRDTNALALSAVLNIENDGTKNIALLGRADIKGHTVADSVIFVDVYVGKGKRIDIDKLISKQQWQGGDNDNDDGGGSGGGDNTSDNIYFSPLPTIDIVGAHVFKCNTTTINDLNSWLWSTDFDSLIQKYFNSPSEAIIGLSLINTSITDGNAKNIIVGNLDSGISAIEINNWLEINCGSVDITEYFTNYVDYSPTTDVTLFLPYVGFVPIDTDLVMNNTISIHYLIELISGSGLVELLITNKRDGNTYIYQTYPCACTMTVPLSSTDKNQMISALINLCGSVGTGLVTGGASPAVLGSAINGAISMASAKNHVQPISGQGQTMGFLGHRYPYIIIKRTTISHPRSYPNLFGYPNNTTQKIGNMSGFTKIKSCHLEFDTELLEEKNEIMNLLQSGIML